MATGTNNTAKRTRIEDCTLSFFAVCTVFVYTNSKWSLCVIWFAVALQLYST